MNLMFKARSVVLELCFPHNQVNTLVLAMVVLLPASSTTCMTVHREEVRPTEGSVLEGETERPAAVVVRDTSSKSLIQVL